MIVYGLLALAVGLVLVWWFGRLSVREISKTYRIISGLISAGSLVAMVFTKIPLWVLPTVFFAIPVLSAVGFFKRKNTNTQTMALQQAYEILGLSPTASQDDVMTAHRNLVKKVHPDTGGNDFLVRQINDARDTVLHHLSTHQGQADGTDNNHD